MEEWNKKLEEEGMPEEPELQGVSEEHTAAFSEAVGDIEEYFLTMSPERLGYGIHRVKMDEVLNRLKASGGSESEIAQMEADMDGFAHEIEDAVGQVHKRAIELGQNIVRQREILASRPEVLARAIQLEMKKESFPVQPSTILHAAQMAAGSIAH